MGAAEKTAAENIAKQVRDIAKTAHKYDFQRVGQQVAQLKALVEKANGLPGANPDPDSLDHEYPLHRQSHYLDGDRNEAIRSKIDEVVPAHACACDPNKCECSSSEETVCPADTTCKICDEKIPTGGALHISQASGDGLCTVCARILWEKVRNKESVAYAVVNLLGDASSEADPPYFQFKQSLKHIEDAQKRLEAFRLVQRAKVAAGR
jgi:hypothetical protein